MYYVTIYCDNGNGKYVHPKSGLYSAKAIDLAMPLLLTMLSDGTDNMVSFEVSKSGE